MSASRFLYIVPLKQGLKQIIKAKTTDNKFVFIHSSIKTRIETIPLVIPKRVKRLFLYIVPLKQGLKQLEAFSSSEFFACFYT